MSPLSHLTDTPGNYLHTVRDYVLRPLTILRGVRGADVPADLIAGLTVAAVAVPQAIAYASIAELPPHVGLWTAAIAAIVGSLWGSSRFLASGPVNAVSLLVLPTLLAIATPGSREFLLAGSLLAIMAGLGALTLALLRFGALVTLASRAVLLGFVAGAALHIGVGQLRHLLGLHVPAAPELYMALQEIGLAVSDTHLPTAAIGGGALMLMIALKRLIPRVPPGLTVITLAAAVTAAMKLHESGVRIVGEIPRTLPPLSPLATGSGFELFTDMQTMQSLVIGASAVAALGLVEAVASAQTLARRAGDRLDSNQEFFGQGMANLLSGLLSGYPCSGSFTRSALARDAGARTHLTGVFTGLTILAAMLLLAPWARFIPRAAISGVLLVIAWNMVDREAIVRAVRASRAEASIMAITFAATLVLPLDFAILSGIVFSLALFVIRSSLPRVYPVVPDPTHRHLVHDTSLPVCPQIGLLNLRGPLFFGAVYHIEEALKHNHEDHPGQHTLVLRMHGVDICDMSGVEMLESIVRTYRDRGGDVYLIRLREPVQKTMEQSGFIDDVLGRDHILPAEGAIERLFERAVRPEICTYECEHRVFSECGAVEKHVYGADVPPAPEEPAGHPLQVPPDEFQRLMKRPGVALLDMREPGEHSAVHIPGAMVLPLRELLENPESLPRDIPLMLCCRSGRRAARALFVLEKLGYGNLTGLRGGVLAWVASGLPVVEDGGERETERLLY